MTDSQPQNRMGKAVRWLIATIVVTGASAAVIWGFIEGRNERVIEAGRESPVEAPLRVSTVGGEPTITLDAATRQNSGIQTAQLQNAAREPQLQAYGTVLDLQTLTELSNSYSAMKAQLQTAQAKADASRMAFERERRLYQDQQNVSAAQAQATEAAFRVDEASVAAAEAQLQNLASSAVLQWGAVLGGALVDRSSMLLRLLQRRDVLVQVTLPPGEVLKEPPKVTVAQAGDAIRSNMQYLSPAPRTDVRIQGISFLYIAPAASGLLPGMNVAVMLPAGKAAEGALVPPSAVVWYDGEAWAYFRTGAQTFVRREIATSTPSPDGGYIVKGLPNDAEVVSQGGQLLLSEEFRSQIQLGEEGR